MILEPWPCPGLGKAVAGFVPELVEGRAGRCPRLGFRPYGRTRRAKDGRDLRSAGDRGRRPVMRWGSRSHSSGRFGRGSAPGSWPNSPLDARRRVRRVSRQPRSRCRSGGVQPGGSGGRVGRWSCSGNRPVQQPSNVTISTGVRRFRVDKVTLDARLGTHWPKLVRPIGGSRLSLSPLVRSLSLSKGRPDGAPVGFRPDGRKDAPRSGRVMAVRRVSRPGVGVGRRKRRLGIHCDVSRPVPCRSSRETSHSMTPATAQPAPGRKFPGTPQPARPWRVFSLGAHRADLSGRPGAGLRSTSKADPRKGFEGVELRSFVGRVDPVAEPRDPPEERDVTTEALSDDRDQIGR